MGNGNKIGDAFKMSGGVLSFTEEKENESFTQRKMNPLLRVLTATNKINNVIRSDVVNQGHACGG